MDNDLLEERETERKKFLDQVKRLMMEHQEKTSCRSGRMKAQVGWAIAMGIVFTDLEKLPPIKNTSTGGGYETEITLFRSEIMPGILRFARTYEEGLMMVGELYTWVTNSITTHTQAPYEKQLLNEPEKILWESVTA